MWRLKKFVSVSCVVLLLFTYLTVYKAPQIVKAASNQINVNLSEWVLDEGNATIYAVSAESKKVLFIRMSDLSVEKQIDLENSPSDLVMANGKLYIPLTNYNWFDNYVKKIVVIDIASKSIEKTIATQGDSFKVAVDGNKLFYSEYDQWCNVYAYDLLNNTEQLIGNYYYPKLTVDTNNHILYIGESGSSGSDLLSIHTTDYTKASQSTYDNGYGFSYPSRKLVFDNNSIYYAGRRFDANNLNTIYGDYKETIIYAKGNYAFSSSSVYDRDTYNKLVSLHPNTISLACMDSNGKVYIYNANSKSVLKFDSVSSLNRAIGSIEILGRDTFAIPTYIGIADYYNALVKDQYGTPISGQSVTWSVYSSVYNPTSSISINQSGALTINNNAAAGNYIIKAESTSSSVYSTKNITLYQQIPSNVVVYGNWSSIPIPATSYFNSNYYYTEIRDQYNAPMANQSVVWAVYDSAYQPVAPLSITNYGRLTVNSNATVGSYIIKAAIQSNPLLYATLSINLSAPIVSHVSISGDTSIDIPSNGSTTYQYTASISDYYYYPISNQSVSWAVYDNRNRLVSMPAISTNGLLTVSSEASFGAYLIRATSNLYPTLYSDSYLYLNKDPALNISSASFDKNTSVQSDITVTMATYGNYFYGIKNNNIYLIQGTHYTLSGSNITINKGYLATLPVGTTTLIFYFNNGQDPQLTINIVDTTVSNSTINPMTAIFDKNLATQGNINLTMSLNGNLLNEIKNGSSKLTQGVDFTATASTITIYKQYLASLQNGTITLDFVFNAGMNASISIGIFDTSDYSAPIVIGVSEGGVYNTDREITFSEGTATLNGTLFISGTKVSAEGSHTLVVTDAANNVTTAHFTIDKTAPIVTGVSEGGAYATDREITFNEGTAKLNSNTFASGTIVSTNGSYILVVTDLTGNITSVNFTINKPVLLPPNQETGGGGGGGGGGGNSSVDLKIVNDTANSIFNNSNPTEVIKRFNNVMEQTGTQKIIAPVINGTMTVNFDRKAFDALTDTGTLVSQTVDSIQGRLKEMGYANNTPVEKRVIMEIKPINEKVQINNMTVNLPTFALEILSNQHINKIQMNSTVANILFVPGFVSAGNAKNLQFILNKSDNQGKPVIDISVNLLDDGMKMVRAITDFSDSVEIQIPYTLKPDEDKNGVTVMYIAPNGTRTDMKGTFIPTDNNNSGVVVFKTNHFSKYEVAYTGATAIFDDIKTHWAKVNIEFMASKNIVKGYGNVFNPDSNITRAEFATILVNALGVHERGDRNSFTDVAQDAWYKDTISKAYTAKIISGMDDAMFAPEKEVTREEMASMLMRAYSYKSGKKLEDIITTMQVRFNDEGAASDWARRNIILSNAVGLVLGNPDGTFAPKDNTKRAEAVVVIERLMKVLGMI